MSAFWVRLEELEEAHRLAKRAHEIARRRLEAARRAEASELSGAWQEYCDAIGILDEATSALEFFRGGSIHAFSD
jgi:hypothetical protein